MSEMPLPTLAATAAAVVLTTMAALQLLLAAGAPLGHMVWGGRAGGRVLPAQLRIASVAAAPVRGLLRGPSLPELPVGSG